MSESSTKKEQFDIEFAKLPPVVQEYIGELRARNKKLKGELAEREPKIEPKPDLRDIDSKDYKKVKAQMLRDLGKKKFGAPTPETLKVEVSKLDKSAYREARAAFLRGLSKGERR